MSTIPAQQRAWSLLAGLAISAGVYVAAQVRAAREMVMTMTTPKEKEKKKAIDRSRNSITIHDFLFVYKQNSPLTRTRQRELYRSVARIIDSSSSAPKAPKKKVREREERESFQRSFFSLKRKKRKKKNRP